MPASKKHCRVGVWARTENEHQEDTQVTSLEDPLSRHIVFPSLWKECLKDWKSKKIGNGKNNK